MSEFRHDPQPCLNCGVMMDAATNVADNKLPGPGDIAICLYCGHLMAFADNLTYRPLTDAEMFEAAGDPRIIAAQKARGEM